MFRYIYNFHLEIGHILEKKKERQHQNSKTKDLEKKIIQNRAGGKYINNAYWFWEIYWNESILAVITLE